MSNMQVPFAVLTDKGFKNYLGVAPLKRAGEDAFKVVQEKATYKTLNPIQAKYGDALEACSKNKLKGILTWAKNHKGATAGIALAAAAVGTGVAALVNKFQKDKATKTADAEAMRTFQG